MSPGGEGPGQDNYFQVIYNNPQHLDGYILYKAIYWGLYAYDTFTGIEESKTIHNMGLTQNPVLSLIFDLQPRSLPQKLGYKVVRNWGEQGLELFKRDTIALTLRMDS